MLISETFQNLEIGQLYLDNLDKGQKQIASKYAGRNIDKPRKERNESTENVYWFLDGLMYNVQDMFY